MRDPWHFRLGFSLDLSSDGRFSSLIFIHSIGRWWEGSVERERGGGRRKKMNTPSYIYVEVNLTLITPPPSSPETHTRTHTHVHTHMYTHTHTCTHTCTDIRTHAHTYARTHTYICACACTHTHTHTYMCMYTHTHTHTHTTHHTPHHTPPPTHTHTRLASAGVRAKWTGGCHHRSDLLPCPDHVTIP